MVHIFAYSSIVSTENIIALGQKQIKKILGNV